MSTIAETVAKLLAKGRDPSCTEAEADAFLSKAQALMSEHNLSMATLEATGQPGTEKRVKDASRQSLMFKWKRDLLEKITNVNFCLLVIKTEKTAGGQDIAKGYELIGRISNVTACKQTFEYLTQAVERVLVQHVGTNPQARYNRWSHTFRQGCSERLGARLEQRHRQYLDKQAREAREANARAKHPGSTGTALAVVMVDFAQKEADDNNDIRWGYAIGTTAAHRASNAARRAAEDAARKLRKEEFRAQYPDLHDDVIVWMACGLSLEAALARHAAYSKPETPAQARKRKEANQRWWDRQADQERRRNSHHHSEGYRKGYEMAESISLDDQIDGDETPKLG